MTGTPQKKILLLLRHAKSAWDDMDQDDFERPLTKRGTKAASKMGTYLAQNTFAPSIILCSEAVRTRATCALVVAELDKPAPNVVVSEHLYLASPVTLLDHVRQLEDAHDTALVIAHNPGLHALALSLTGTGNRRDISEMSMKFPTAALAVLEFANMGWDEIGPAKGELCTYQIPRALD